MQIEITPEADPADLARLTQTLSGVLADVRAAVDRLAADARGLARGRQPNCRRTPPPVPAAELAEVQDFLRWLDDDNFTFLGFREYLFDGAAKPEHGPLGILRDEAHSGLRRVARPRRRCRPTCRISSAAASCWSSPNQTAARRFTGPLTWMRSACGGSTQTARSSAFASVPRPLHVAGLQPQSALDPAAAAQGPRIVERAGLSPASHDGKALLHILDTFPRDELFQTDEDQLFDTVIGILNLQERQRIARVCPPRPARALRFLLRLCAARALRQRIARAASRRSSRRRSPGRCRPFYTHLDEFGAGAHPFHHPHDPRRGARGRYRGPRTAARRSGTQLDGPARGGGGDGFRRRGGACPAAPLAVLPDRLSGANGRRPGGRRSARGSRRCLAGSPLEVSLHPAADAQLPGLRLYRAKEPVALSDVLPILENLGLRVVAEEPFRIDSADGARGVDPRVPARPGSLC